MKEMKWSEMKWNGNEIKGISQCIYMETKGTLFKMSDSRQDNSTVAIVEYF